MDRHMGRDEWMERQTYEQTDGWTVRQICRQAVRERQSDRLKGRLTGRQTDKQTVGPKDRLVYEWMGRQMGRRMDGWLDR